MKRLLLAAVLAMTAGAASAETLAIGEPATVRSTFCRSAASARSVLLAYETSGGRASNHAMRPFRNSGECIVNKVVEIVPLEIVYETADGYARIIKVGHPEMPYEFVYMLTVKYTIEGE